MAHSQRSVAIALVIGIAVALLTPVVYAKPERVALRVQGMG